MTTGYLYDQRVLDLIRSGVGTVAAIRREVRVPPGTLKKVFSRLHKAKVIRTVVKGWYEPCAE
jgi:DNA-binding IscR family transcriptional regulator